MPDQALPCIICGRELRNAAPEVTNQPEDGVSATTSGNYGSRVFDSLSGEMLEFSVCDPCLVEAGQLGRVLSSRPTRPVTVDGVQVGWEMLDPRPVSWHAGLPGIEDVCRLEVDELMNLPKSVRLSFTPEEIASWNRTEENA